MQSIPPLRFDAAGRRDGRGLGVVWGRHYLSKLLVGLRAVLARPRLDAQIGFQFWFLATNHPLCGAVTTAKHKSLAGARSKGRFVCRVHRGTGRLADINGKLLRGTKVIKGVPRAHKDRHWCHYEANKHWIEWVDDGLSERADVGPAKKRKLLPPSLR